MRRILFFLSRKKFFRNLIGWACVNISTIVPLERLIVTACWIAFRHPEPVYPTHILLAAKKAHFYLISYHETK